MNDAATVTVESHERWAKLSIDRPPLNILDIATVAALTAEVDRLAARPELQLLVLQGGGSKAFSAGVSIQDHTPDMVETMLTGFHLLIRKLYHCPAVTLAVVDGHCLGGGLELAAACDLVLATDESSFAQPEIELGCFPPVATALFPAIVGASRALELVLTGRRLSAPEATALGLVTWCVPRAQLDARVDEIREQILSKSTSVTRLTKKALRAGREKPFESALAAAERIYLDELIQTEDMNEGLTAFQEKRPPHWKHR